MGGRREVGIVSHRPVTSSDLKQDRSFSRWNLSTFLQLVVAPPLISAFQDLFCLMLMIYSVVVATPKPLITRIKLSCLSIGGYSILTELFAKNAFLSNGTTYGSLKTNGRSCTCTVYASIVYDGNA